jgi:hypothetical protein
VNYDEIKRQRQRELIAALHPGFPIEEPGESDGPPNFDGGVRGVRRLPLPPWPHNRLPPGWDWDPEG